MALESQFVRQRLAEMKVAPTQIEARLSKFSDAQWHRTASRIQRVSVGSDSGGLVITVFRGAVLIVYALKASDSLGSACRGSSPGRRRTSRSGC